MTKVAIVGNVSLDILFQISRLPRDHEKLAAEAMVISGGGAPANVAHWLARLGHDVHVFSVTGTDPLSGVAVDSLRTVGVDVSGIRRRAEIGPSISAIFTGGAHKSMVGGRRQAMEPWAELVGELDLSGYDHVHIVARLHPLLFAGGRRADLRGRTVSADLNGSYSPDLVADLDFAFTNHDEISARTGTHDIAALLAADLAGRPHHLLVTHAAEEVSCYRSGAVTRVVPDPAPAVDRAGGGDAFCAGYLHASWVGAPPQQAIRAGLRLARATLSALGCRPDTPEVDAALAALGGRS
jgi:sugar/nucleoside kinase (ribokinase family)